MGSMESMDRGELQGQSPQPMAKKKKIFQNISPTAARLPNNNPELFCTTKWRSFSPVTGHALFVLCTDL